MNKILVIIPIKALNDEQIEKRKNFLNKFVSENTKIDLIKIKGGPDSIESRYDEMMSSQGIFEIVKEKENEYDIVIIWCANDAMVDELKEYSVIPVIGPAEASISIAQILANNISIIVTTRKIVPAVKDLINKKKLERKIISVRSLEIPVLELHKNKEETKKRIKEEAIKAIKEDGAEAIVLGCLGMYDLIEEIKEEIKRELGVPIINPAIAVILFAELMIKMNLEQSRIAYPKKERNS